MGNALNLQTSSKSLSKLIPSENLAPVELHSAIIQHPLLVSADITAMDAIMLMSDTRTLCPMSRATERSQNELHLEARSSCVLIMAERQLLGIFTERDVVRLSAENCCLAETPLRDVMTSPVMTLRQAAFTDLFTAINLLKQQQIRHLPILDEQDFPIGLLTHESLRQICRPVELLRLRLVSEVMTREVICAAPATSVQVIAALMHQHRVSSVIIVSPSPDPSQTTLQIPIGIITERDLVQFQALNLTLESCQARAIMSTPVFSVPSDESLWAVQHLMEEHFIQRVVVTGNQGELQGIVTQSSLLQALNPLELYNLAEVLEAKVERLEAEKVTLLQSRNSELEQQVTLRTADLQQRIKREQVMANLATLIRSSLNLQTLLDTTVEQIRQVIGCDRVTIWQFDADGECVVLAESTDSPDTLKGKRLSDVGSPQPSKEVYRQGDIRVVPDIYTTAMTDCHRALLRKLHIRAKVLLPLFRGEQLWGLLQVAESQTAREWQPDEVELLENLATQLVIAIQQASTYEQLQHELQERQQAEVQLRLSAERLWEAQRIAHIGNWELDLQHNALYWSEEVFRIFEIDPQVFDASYEAFLNLVHPADRGAVDEAYSNHLRDRRPYSLVHRLQMPDGRIKHVREQCETRYSADGTPQLSRGTVQDITQQQAAESRRDRAEASLRQVIEGTAAFTGEAFFPALVRHIAEALGVRYVSISQATSEGFQVLAFFADGTLAAPPFLSYDQVPCCWRALQTGNFCHPEGIPTLYPDNALFTDLKVESYLGVGLRNAAGDPTGNLCILHDRPLADPDWAQTLLSIFAARAGAELERYQTAQTLEQLTVELEARVAQRTAELAEREALLEDFLHNASDLIQMVTIDTGRFEFVNRAWREVLGYTAAEVEQLTMFDILAPNCHDHCQAVMAQMQAGALTHLDQVELTFVSKSGQTVLVEGSINCRFVSDGTGGRYPISTRAIFRDITAKRAAEQEIQRREARYRGLMEGAADAILLADLDGHILEANQKAEELLGYPLAELTTLHFTQLHPPGELPKVGMIFGEMAEQQRSQVLDVICQRRDGTQVPVDITATVLEIGGEKLLQGIFRDITDRKQVENALLESQQFLQTVLDTVPIAVFWKDRDLNYLGSNRQFLRDTALMSPAELIRKTDFDLPWGTADAEAYRADDRRVMETGEAKLGTLETLHLQDGTEIWLETNKLPLRNLQGEVVGILGTYQDITARRHAELTLKRQLAAIEAAIDGIAILQDGRYHYLNSSHVRMFGYERAEELMGQSWQALYSSEQLKRFESYIFPLLKQHKSWQGEVMATRRDGSTFPLQLSLTLSADNLLIGVCQDISDRKQAELALQESETRFRRVFASNVVGMMFTDFSGQVTDANDRLLEIIGYSRADLDNGRINWASITPPEYVEKDQWAINHLTRYGAIHPWEKEYLRPDGRRVAVLIGVAMLSKADGRCVSVIVDISDRKAAAAELLRTNAELERATRLKDEFLANMSHELRTPLNAILGMTEGLQDEVFGIVNEKQLKALRTVENSASHLLALINDILDVAKIESGQITLERSQVSVKQLCSSSLTFIKQQALKKRIKVETLVPAQLPRLYVDELRVRQALLNLLTNAVKFTPEGGTVTLKVSEVATEVNSTPQHFLRIAVEDTGIGIAPENIGKLFQPFVQIDSALNRQHTGTGLGLALVKQIVELHGGRVGLTSELGVGSCFTIDLPGTARQVPVDCPTASAAPADELSTDQPIATVSTQAPLILLAEDNLANIYTISSYLTAKGYRLLLAHNGQEAIDCVQAQIPDLILMDIQLPEVDGLTAIQQIRQAANLQDIPIIALTALAMEGDRERCLAAGADDYLSKPVKLKQLEARIHQFLSLG